MSAETWATIHAERAALIADLESLAPDRWSTPSLCAAWSVRDVLAHMTATAKMTTPKFMGRFIGSGFRFNAMTAADVRRELGDTPAQTLAEFAEQRDAVKHPPGPLTAMVGEIVIHAEDIRNPLGIARAYPAEALTTVANFVISSNLLLGGKRRSEGLTLRATDVEWTTGSGPEVAGPLVSVILALTGRPAGLKPLEGDGVATLTQRVR